MERCITRLLTPNATGVTGAQVAGQSPLLVRPCSRRGWASLLASLDYLIGAQQDSLWNGDAENSCRLDIDD